MFQAQDDPSSSLAPEEKIQKAQEVTQSRFLTQEEFKQLRVKELAKQMGAEAKGPRGKKRTSTVVEEEEKGPGWVAPEIIPRLAEFTN